ncbi:DUF4175 family protein [Mucilaginibacter sp. HD30]
MAKHGADIIKSLKQKWIGYQLLADALLAIAIALAAGNAWFLINKIRFLFLPQPWWLVPLFIISFAIITFARRSWRITTASLTAFLDQTYPRLQESAELILRSPADLTLLQKLQLKRIEGGIAQIPSLPKEFLKRLKIASGYLLAAVIITFLMRFVTVFGYATGDNIISSTPIVKEKVLPQIESIALIITPPVYTGKPKHKQDKFGFVAEEGSVIGWRISTNIPLKKLSLLFNNQEYITLKTNKNGDEWTGERLINKPGFYQVSADGKLSDLYQVDIIKDNAPLVSIKSPKQYTFIDAGEALKVTLKTTLTDDYGINKAFIYATVAKGSGEAVKFKAYKISFGESFYDHNKHYTLQHLFDLPAFEMEPGDELYFYVEAFDNRQQKTRTDVYTIAIQDTAALLSMKGLVSSSSIKPEYFRSQRQIIIDTEQLLKQKDSLSKEAFNSTANDIGIDQKMLRLRYGRFLGEEDESDIDKLSEKNELSKVENFNNSAMILDALTDKHDNAEVATFLEPALKAQLRATLNEMWNAELRLRLYKPNEALPYEYKALRLLKDLQQKSRAYVAKTAYDPTPLKLDKRLSGDLGTITQPFKKSTTVKKDDEFINLKNAIPILEQLKITRKYTLADKRILQLATQQISIKASTQPQIYLKALNALNRIVLASYPLVQDIDLVQHAIQKALPESTKLPQSKPGTPDMGLSQHYYQNLRTNR